MFSKSGFELMTCSRCGGSGNYSYCEAYGSRCFKCAGNKVCLTAKGKAAFLFYNESLLVSASSLVVGDLMQIDDFFKGKKYFAAITEIKPSTSLRKMADGSWESIGIEISTEHPKYGASGLHTSPESLIIKGWDAAFKAEKLAEAMAYQASLTKAGTPRKGAAAKAA
jgi:hypothetical protein